MIAGFWSEQLHGWSWPLTDMGETEWDGGILEFYLSHV